MASFDVTRLKPLYDVTEDADVSMYSFDTPAYRVWDLVSEVLESKGLSEEEVIAILRSKQARRFMDNTYDAFQEMIYSEANKFFGDDLNWKAIAQGYIDA